MNAKRLTSIAALAMSAMMLVGCGNTSSSAAGSSEKAAMTRTEAVAVLTAIDTAVKADGFVAPTKGIIAGKTTTVNVSSADNFVSVVYAADKTSKSSEVIAKKGAEVYGWGTAASYSVYMVSGDTKTIYTDTTGTLKASVDKKITAYLGKATYASAFAKYLGNFNDDGSAVTGGTAKNATLTKQSYVSTGAGNLTVDITAHYSYDESIVYKWDKNLCLAQKSSDDLKMTWGSATTTAPTTTGATAATDSGAAILAAM